MRFRSKERQIISLPPVPLVARNNPGQVEAGIELLVGGEQCRQLRVAHGAVALSKAPFFLWRVRQFLGERTGGGDGDLLWSWVGQILREGARRSARGDLGFLMITMNFEI